MADVLHLSEVSNVLHTWDKEADGLGVEPKAEGKQAPQSMVPEKGGAAYC